MADVYVNISRGKTATQSSFYQNYGNASLALTAGPTGALSFCTDLQDAPWWTVDLGGVFSVHRITVWNREDCGPDVARRAIPLQIEHSHDNQTWKAVLRCDYLFGGALSDSPLTATLAEPVLTRYVRLRVIGTSYLHLDHVEVLTRVPENAIVLPHATATNIRPSRNAMLADLRLLHSAGFFSNCTILLETIMQLAARGIAVDRIDATSSFLFFKDDPLDSEYFHEFFDVRPDEIDANVRHDSFAWPEVHGCYKTMDYGKFRRFVRSYFSPSADILGHAGVLAEKYGIDPDNTLCIWYRGTDKKVELAPVEVDHYVKAADSILRDNPNLRVVVQTDQQQVLEYLTGYYKDRCVYFPELPATQNDVGFHHEDIPGKYAITRKQFSKWLLAAVILLSKSKHLVSHTGNVGFWLALYRDNPVGLRQFNGDNPASVESGS